MRRKLNPFESLVLHSILVWLIAEGLGLPVDEWQQAIQAQLDKIRKLEEDYESELTGKKVSLRSTPRSIQL